jgi:uncharacterized NAD-dependent epimerase/dehydratase family protein
MRAQAKRRYVALTEGFLTDPHHAKTAHGVLRYSADPVVAIVDRAHAGDNLRDVLPELGKDVPIVSSVREALAFSPTALLVGVAVSGGALPAQFRAHLLDAVDARLEIVNGLHQFVTEDAEIVARARASGARLWDVRKPGEIPLFSGAAYRVPQVVVLAVGSDCAVGKMSVMLELAAAATSAGDQAAFAASGQTGIMIAGKGIAVDRVISDFVSGAAEQLVLDVPADTAFTLVEGQGSILNPAFAAVTYGLMFGCAPDLLVLCHEAGRDAVEDFDVPIPPLAELGRLYEITLKPVKPAPCIAVALNTRSLAERDARSYIAEITEQTRLPADDVVRFGAGKLWQAIRAAAEQTAKWQHRPQAAKR